MSSTREYKPLVVSIEIKDSRTEAEKYEQSKTELTRCISLIKTQIKKKKAPKYFLRSSLMASILGAGYSMLRNGLAFAESLNIFENAGPVTLVERNTKGLGYKSSIFPETFINNITTTCGHFYDYIFSEVWISQIGSGCSGFFTRHSDYFDPNSFCMGSIHPTFPETLYRLNCDSHQFCHPKLQDVCDNPWAEYFYPVIVVGGTVAATAWLVKEIRRDSTAFCVRRANLDHLKDDDFEIIQTIANRHQFAVSPDEALEDLLKKFEFVLKKLNVEYKNYLCRQTFVAGGHFGTNSLLNFLIQSEENLCQDVFEFAGMESEQVKEKRTRQTFLSVTSDKNQHAALHGFFKKLTNDVDEKGHQVYDQKNVVGKIFEFAGIRQRK